MASSTENPGETSISAGGASLPSSVAFASPHATSTRVCNFWLLITPSFFFLFVFEAKEFLQMEMEAVVFRLVFHKVHV
jgi:hypothetical protein